MGVVVCVESWRRSLGGDGREFRSWRRDRRCVLCYVNLCCVMFCGGDVM